MSNRVCLGCNQSLMERWQKKYCSNKCQAEYQYQFFKDGWLSGKRKVVTMNISRHIRRYLLEQQGEKCSECGWQKKHPVTKRVPLEIDHTDGNASNNDVRNVRLICPNCHSLTPSFRALNKGNGRTWRVGAMKRPD